MSDSQQQTPHRKFQWSPMPVLTVVIVVIFALFQVHAAGKASVQKSASHHHAETLASLNDRIAPFMRQSSLSSEVQALCAQLTEVYNASVARVLDEPYGGDSLDRHGLSRHLNPQDC